jgi:hypothetical protein
VVASFVDLRHAAVHPCERARQDRAPGNGFAQIDPMEAVLPAPLGKSARRLR